LKKENKIRIFAKDIPFNFSQLNNWTALKAKGNYIFFINSEIV